MATHSIPSYPCEHQVNLTCLEAVVIPVPGPTAESWSVRCFGPAIPKKKKKKKGGGAAFKFNRRIRTFVQKCSWFQKTVPHAKGDSACLRAPRPECSPSQLWLGFVTRWDLEEPSSKTKQCAFRLIFLFRLTLAFALLLLPHFLLCAFSYVTCPRRSPPFLLNIKRLYLSIFLPAWLTTEYVCVPKFQRSLQLGEGIAQW